MTKDYCMRAAEQELTLRSALSDPLIRSLMAADNVDPVELESTLMRIAEQVTLSPMSTMKARCVC
jgi:hypothetical protein